MHVCRLYTGKNGCRSTTMTVMSSRLPLLLAMAASSLHGSVLRPRARRCGGGGGGDGVDRLLVGHLAPEAVGGEDEEAAVAVGGEAHARRLRLARHPLLHAGIAERARHGEAVLHAPHPAAAAAHVPALKCIAHTLIDRQQRRLSACLGA